MQFRVFILILFVVSLLFNFTPIKSYGQKSLHKWKFIVAPSKLSFDPLDEQRFFNSLTIGVQYNRMLVSNLDGVISISFLQGIETRGGKSSDPLDRALDKFHKSFLNLDIGIDLVPIHFTTSSSLVFGVGSGIRRRMEVKANFATMEGLDVVVKNQYKESLDTGGYAYLELSQTFYQNWLLSLRGRLRTYQQGDSVFSVGFSIGQAF